MDVIIVLLGISLILFFGFFAEFIFRKTGIPDVLFLIILGFTIGPGTGWVSSSSFEVIAPVFTTFTLLFILFDSAFNISLSSLVREFSHSFNLTIYNFLISSVVVTAVMVVSGFSFLSSLLTGFMLGGVSSAFVIPIIKQMRIPEHMYSLLTLESALTDVFCIVFSLTVLELMNLGSFGIQQTFIHLTSLFAVAGLIGVLGGIIWTILVLRVFKEHNYIMVVAFLLLLYVTTEFLNGNGAIATLFFGLVLNNSKQLSSIVKGILSRKSKDKKKALEGELGVSVTTPSEEYFYHQISFLLKTFFFVYIGVLIDISDMKALIIGGILSIVLAGSRMASLLLTKKMDQDNKNLVNSVFARGLAAAVIAQLAVQRGIPHAEFLLKVAFITITGTILISSVRVFLLSKELPGEIKKPPKGKRKHK